MGSTIPQAGGLGLYKQTKHEPMSEPGSEPTSSVPPRLCSRFLLGI